MSTSVREFLLYALDKHPDKVSTAPLMGELRHAVRKNDKRPAYLQIFVDDDVVKAANGPPELAKHYFYIIKVDRKVEERMNSNIVLPGEV